MHRSALSCALLSALSAVGLISATATATAQTQTTKTVLLPVMNPVPKTSDVPFAHPKIRYQQWYEGKQFVTVIKQPVRFVGLTFAGSIPTGVTLDIEVILANTGSNLTGNFDQNFISNRVVVLPRTKIVGTGGAPKFTFKNHFVFDGKTDVVVDIKIWGNGLAQKFNYAGRSTISRVSNTRRQYFVGSATAATANSSGVTGHYGLETTFLYQEGGSYPYGTGCPGGNFITPVATSNAVPMPGLGTWTQLLDKAGSGYPAVLLLGISNTTSAGVTLPFNLAFLGASNCSAVASWEFLLFTTTVGGGPGTGSAKMPTPIPAIGSLGGVKIYTQWLVFDRAAGNFNLSASNGLMHVVGS